jgi:GNAT superfamily N-acetyltransferase
MGLRDQAAARKPSPWFDLTFVGCSCEEYKISRPVIYMKELFVAEAHRGFGVGERLMRALEAEAKANGCKTVKWTVAPWNVPGVRFYERLGAKENSDWLDFEWRVATPESGP